MGCAALLAVDRSPRRCGVPASHELLVNRFMAASTIAGRQGLADCETVMFGLFLLRGWLMTVQAIDAVPRVQAQLVFMDHRVLRLAVAFGTFARGPHEFGCRLPRLQPRPLPMDQVPAKH